MVLNFFIFLNVLMADQIFCDWYEPCVMQAVDIQYWPVVNHCGLQVDCFVGTKSNKKPKISKGNEKKKESKNNFYELFYCGGGF